MGEVGVPPALEAAVESFRDAVTAGRTDIVRRLLEACDSCDGGGTEERKQLINSHSAEDGGTFLHLATKLGHGDIVRALLSGGGDPGVANTEGNTPLQVARTAAVMAVYTEDLLRATAQSDLGRVCQLLAGGLSVNAFDNPVSRNTPLHWAASFADTDTLHCLIARGAGVHSVNSFGATPLHDAVARGDGAVVAALLQHGAMPAAPRCSNGRHKGKTPLEMAEERGDEEVVAVMRQYSSGGCPPPSRRGGGGGTGDALDLRGLAGSLESLNSIGGDSVLLTNGSMQAGRYHANGSMDTNLQHANGSIDTIRLYANGSIDTRSRERIQVHHGIRKSVDLGPFGKTTKVVSIDERIQEPANSDGNSTLTAQTSPTMVNGSDVAVLSVKTDPLTAGAAVGVGSADGGHQRRSKSVSLSRSPIHSTSSLDLCPNMEQVYERLASSSMTSPPAPLVTSPRLHLLWPQPRHMAQLPGGCWQVPRLLSVAMVPGVAALHSMCDVLEVHRSSLEECGVKVVLVGALPPLHTSGHCSVVCTIPPALAASPLQYSLTVSEQGVRISCGSLCSLHSALTTLAQLLRVHSLDRADSDAKPQQSNLLRQTSEPLHTNPALSRSQSEDSSYGAPSSPGASQHDKDKDESRVYVRPIEVECLVITDSPDVPYRALMLDAAPLARIPALSTMCQMVDTLVALKLNQLHLMLRVQPASNASTSSNADIYDNTSAAPGIFNAAHLQHNGGISTPNKSNRNASSSCCHCPLPYTSTEIVTLSRYCQDRGLLLVPGFDLDASWCGHRSAVHSIGEVTAAVCDALTNFPDLSFVSIGPGLTAVLSSAASKAVSNPWECLGLSPLTTLIVCANVFEGSDNKHLRGHVPRSALLMEYGFQADYDFTPGRDAAVTEGRPMALCTGTAAWSSLAGFPEAGVSNVYRGCVGKRKASGVSANAACCSVIAHWSTPASLTPLVFMWPALVVGAGLSWNCSTHWEYVNSSIGSLIDTHLVRVSDCGFGNAVVELGRCETWLTREMRGQDNNDLGNLPPASTGPGSTLHQLLADPDNVLLDKLTAEKFGSVIRHMKRSVRDIANNRVVCSVWPLMPVAAAELNLSADLMMTACRLGRALVTVGSNPHSNLGMAVVNPGLAHLPPTLRTDIANRVLSLRESYSCLWLHCHQPPGLQASLLLLSSLLARLLPQNNNVSYL